MIQQNALSSVSKNLILFFFIIHGLQSQSQLSCTIKPADTVVCYGSSFFFRAIATGLTPLAYKWERNHEVIPGETSSTLSFYHVSANDTGVYTCILKNGTDSVVSNDAHLGMYKKMNIDTLYRYNQLNCWDKCNGIFFAKISDGFPPYLYEWSSGWSQDTLVFGLCPGDHLFKVTDSIGCMLSRTFFVDALKSPKVQLEITPDSMLYFSNRTLTVNFPDSMLNFLSSFQWDFGDGYTAINLKPVIHTYQKEIGQYLLKLDFTDLIGCDSVISTLIRVWTAQGNDENDLAGNVIIYPNPAVNSIVIVLPESMLQNNGENSIMINNLGGEIVITQPIHDYKTEINISALPSGIYFIKFVNETFMVYRKLIKLDF